MKITIPKTMQQIVAGTAIALAVVSMLGLLTRSAHADINNPHSLPPNNSVTHVMLRTGIVDDTNVSGTAGIQLYKLGTSLDTGLILFGGASSVATDTALSYNSTGHVLRTTGLITGQASTTFNNVPYTLPSSQGAASTQLTNDGSGNLSWSSPVSDFGLIAHASSVSSAGALKASWTGHYNHLRVIYHTNGFNAADAAAIRFGDDSTVGHYAILRSVNLASPTINGNFDAGLLDLTGTTSPQTYTCDIDMVDTSAISSMCNGTYYSTSGGKAGAPQINEDYFTYATSTTITELEIFGYNGHSMTGSSTVRVYGSTDF